MEEKKQEELLERFKTPGSYLEWERNREFSSERNVEMSGKRNNGGLGRKAGVSGAENKRKLNFSPEGQTGRQSMGDQKKKKEEDIGKMLSKAKNKEEWEKRNKKEMAESQEDEGKKRDVVTEVREEMKIMMEMMAEMKKEWNKNREEERDARVKQEKQMEEVISMVKEWNRWKEKTEKMETKIDGLESMQKAMMEDTARIGVKQESWCNETEKKLEETLNRMSNIEERVEKMEKEKGTIRQEKNDMEEDQEEIKRVEWEKEKKEWSRMKEDLEKEVKRRNIIITGVKWKEGKVEKGEVEKWIVNTLEEKVKVRRVWKIGREGKSGKSGVECEDVKEKEKLMKKKEKLKETDIYIDNDLTWKEREKVREMKKKAFELRKEGRRVKTGVARMWVDGEEWVWSETEKKFREKEGKKR